jgi:hypothetical protein
MRAFQLHLLNERSSPWKRLPHGSQHYVFSS